MHNTPMSKRDIQVGDTVTVKRNDGRDASDLITIKNQFSFIDFEALGTSEEYAGRMFFGTISNGRVYAVCEDHITTHKREGRTVLTGEEVEKLTCLLGTLALNVETLSDSVSEAATDALNEGVERARMDLQLSAST
jgi:hypothetical protein